MPAPPIGQTGWVRLGRTLSGSRPQWSFRWGGVVLFGLISLPLFLGACREASTSVSADGDRGSLPASTVSSSSATVTQRNCGWEDVAVVGNRAQYFLGDVQQGRDPAIAGGVDDPFGCAYDQLCQVIRDEVPEQRFRSSRGEAVSSALSATTESGARHGDFEQVGVDAQYDDMKTLDPTISTAWENVDFSWSDAGGPRKETWRLDFVRDRADWRVCGFTKVG